MDLDRFVSAQEGVWPRALAELRDGRKVTHWMWFVFPQLAVLGRSGTAKFYGISDLSEARAYLSHPVLGPRLHEAAEAILLHGGSGAEDILGPIDAMKLRSSATLFRAAGADWMGTVLERFYDSHPCRPTQEALAHGEG